MHVCVYTLFVGHDDEVVTTLHVNTFKKEEANEHAHPILGKYIYRLARTKGHIYEISTRGSTIHVHKMSTPYLALNGAMLRWQCYGDFIERHPHAQHNKEVYIMRHAHWSPIRDNHQIWKSNHDMQRRSLAYSDTRQIWRHLTIYIMVVEKWVPTGGLCRHYFTDFLQNKTEKKQREQRIHNTMTVNR